MMPQYAFSGCFEYIGSFYEIIWDLESEHIGMHVKHNGISSQCH